MDEKAAEAEEAARQQDTRSLFQISKDLGVRSFACRGQVKKKDGEVAATEVEQLE